MNKNPKERTEYIGIRVTPEEKEKIVKLEERDKKREQDFLDLIDKQ